MVAVAEKNMYDAVAIAGPTKVGKTTLVDHLVHRDPRFMKVLTTTTREPRDGEINGVHYNFISGEEFRYKLAQGDFMEHALVHGKDHYGNSWKDFLRVQSTGAIPVYILNVDGVQTMRGKIGLYTVFLLPPGLPSLDVLYRRLVDDNEKPEAIARRMASVPFEIAEADKYNLKIVNDDLERTYNELHLGLSKAFSIGIESLKKHL